MTSRTPQHLPAPMAANFLLFLFKGSMWVMVFDHFGHLFSNMFTMCMKNPQLGVGNQMDDKFTEIQSRSLGYMYLERYVLPSLLEWNGMSGNALPFDM